LLPEVKLGRILIVDDEIFNIHALQGLIRVLGVSSEVQIDVAYNGEQSMQHIQTAIEEDDPNRYSLILTDCSMPFMDGYESSKMIR
jgi:CheY-like chemotaxis protein